MAGLQRKSQGKRGWSTQVRLWAVLVAAAAAAGPGCIFTSGRRTGADREAERQAEDVIRKAFLAEFEAAMAAKDYEKAAAAFTPQREAKLHRYTFAWGGNQEKLWRAIEDAAKQAESRGALATAVVLCEAMGKMKLPNELRRSVDAATAEYRAKLDAQLAGWNKQLEPARADEQAGRLATAAMRYSALTAAPSKSLLAQTQAPVCGIIAKVALQHRVSVHVKAGKGDAALLEKLLQAVATAAHGPAVQLVPAAEGADVAITVELPPEKLEQTSRVETRQGRYVSGQKPQPNPQIASLQEDIERFEKEARWHEGKVASIRCNGSGKCTTESHRNSARSFREKLAAAQKKLRSEPATKLAPVYSDVSYDVTIRKTRLVQPLVYQVLLSDGKRETRSNEADRWLETLDQPDVHQLGLAAKAAVPPSREELRKGVHEAILNGAGYVVHHNLERRNAALVAKVTAATGADKAEQICTYLAVNPLAAADSVSFANKELLALTSVSSGGTALAAATQRCAGHALKGRPGH